MKKKTRATNLSSAATPLAPSIAEPPCFADIDEDAIEPRSIINDLHKIGEITRAIFPGGWISLQAARLRILLALSARVPSLDEGQFLMLIAYGGKNAELAFGTLAAYADKNTRSMLIRAFDEGKITTRGVEHYSDLQQEMHPSLPLNWWRRTIDSNDTFNPAHVEYPVHEVSWVNGCIHRRRPGRDFWGEPAATVTDVEVCETQLLDLLKSLKGPSGVSAEDPNRWLLQEVLRRQRANELYGRDALVQALQGQFPLIGKNEARRLVDKLPEEFRAKPGRPRKQKSGQD